ncbi:hypothetical protein CERSUDRAFT_109991 [Gelatoporia subvermispora B]|uniref:Protein kinase domain-containing protein n=1 Tax=Ceriporiopsis subvermispora (strain B) TaxID=914234 RepID=M2QWD3_CERS8|nr:hypothetical protein CERSUDRAFT_109991 [Gelatoporia subvermispora B]
MGLNDEEYNWQQDELEALINRGIRLQGQMDPKNKVRVAYDTCQRECIVKVMSNDSDELDVLQRLLALPSPRNHVIPCELIRCKSSTLAFMPLLRVLSGHIIPYHGVQSILDFMTQMVEALDFMHEHYIAYSDVANLNIVAPSKNTPAEFPPFSITRGRYYIIDFGSSRVLPKGPGEGLLVGDFFQYPGHFMPPEGTDAVDPYAYDVYSLGETIHDVCEAARHRAQIQAPRSVLHLVNTLRSPDPSRRPTMRQLVGITRAICFWVSNTTWLYKVFPAIIADYLDYYGWRLIRVFV